jgi:hypothetical protein
MKSIISADVSRRLRGATQALLGLTLTMGAAASLHAQGQIASGTITSSGAGPYTYNITFSDGAGATSPIGSVWYSWVPGQTFLPGDPTSATAPNGWTATLSGNSIQFTANAVGDDITAGTSLSGFSYNAAFSPSQLASAPNSEESVAYHAGLFSDNPGDTFNVLAPVPEPSTIALFAVGGAALLVLKKRRMAN